MITLLVCWAFLPFLLCSGQLVTHVTDSVASTRGQRMQAGCASIRGWNLALTYFSSSSLLPSHQSPTKSYQNFSMPLLLCDPPTCSISFPWELVRTLKPLPRLTDSDSAFLTKLQVLPENHCSEASPKLLLYIFSSSAC